MPGSCFSLDFFVVQCVHVWFTGARGGNDHTVVLEYMMYKYDIVYAIIGLPFGSV